MILLFSQLWEHLRAFRKWESISLGLSGSVGTQDHAVAGIQDHAVAGIQGHAVAEAPTGVARALLYILSSLSIIEVPS